MLGPLIKKASIVFKDKIANKFSTGARLIWTDKDYLMFAIVYLVQGSFGLTTVSFPLFLREDLGLTAFQVTTLIASYGILWSIKPLYGFITDAFPIFGLRRKPYIFIFSMLAALTTTPVEDDMAPLPFNWIHS